ncbi:thioesterase family protein [Blastococcus sp. Marseille-P5729]|uniref:acyl-CoA thioesterase n=1 Tax=Blastococcus sp. Marseille-P5729 TaxID=2086582 RepID=UPI000D0E9A49|nr:thioesterase family protein [Blastococcus sp. Marseille-P5729]
MAIAVHVPDDTWRMPLTVRYYEADQQNVVFHGWYLNYFDEAFTAYAEAIGYSIQRAHADGADWMVVHSEIEWHGSLRWPDAAEIAVSAVHVGNSSMTIDFAALRDGEAVCSARNVYVMVDAEEYTRIEVPQALREALGRGQSLRRPRAGR